MRKSTASFSIFSVLSLPEAEKDFGCSEIIGGGGGVKMSIISEYCSEEVNNGFYEMFV